MLLEGTVEAVRHARQTGYRALLVVGAGDRLGLAGELASLAGGDCALIGDQAVRRGLCRVELSPARYREILGTEHHGVIVSLESMVRPSIVAAAGEAVRGGGFLALVGPPWGEWSLGPRGGPGHYKEYLASRIPAARLHAWQDQDRLLSRRLSVGPAPGRGGGWKSRAGVPGKVMGLARTGDQARLLDEMLRFLRGGARSLLVLGDRGRGKSYATGLGLSVGVKFKLAGNVAVVGPGEESVQQVFRGLMAGLDALGIPYRVRERRGLTVRVSGAWFRVSYQPPDRRVQEPLVVIDEAAAVGPARARRLMWRAAKSIVSTTIHGYEGSGLSFAILLERWLPRPYVRVTLEEPVRYPPGDPLEEWLYDTFMLRPDPAPARLEGEPRRRLVRPGELARDYGLLRSVYTILAQAHYRTTPDSLLLLLEAPHHHVHILEAGGSVVAVAEIVDEEAGGPQAALAGERLRLMAGGSPGRVARVSRIAVAPALQRRGLGSLLLRGVEEWARGEGYTVMATIFSRHEVAPFWLRNGYKPFYASPRYNRATGEKNLGFAKPLAPGAEPLVREAHRAFARRLILLAPSIYRDLEAETVSLLLSMPSGAPAPPMTPGELRRLRLFLEGVIGYEQAMDAALLALARIALERGLPEPGSRRTVLLVARIIQGKPLDEAASIAGVPLERAAREVEEALRHMLGGLGGSP